MESEKSLVQKTLQGDSASFDELIKLNQEDVFITVYRIVRDSDIALDICQDVFIKTFKNLKKFQFNSSFKTWLIRISINETISWLRKNTRNKKYKINLETAKGIENPDGTPETIVIQNEKRAQLNMAIAQLNIRYQKVILLRYFQEMSIREISRVMACSEGTVKSMLFRSVRKLKSILQR